MGATPRSVDTVGVIGVGDMGSTIATTLRRAGFPVLAFDIDPERGTAAIALGLEVVDSIAALAARAPVVLVVVDGEPAFTVVAEQLLVELPPGALVVVHTTVRPDVVTAFAERAAQRSVDVVDAATNGGSERAASGGMTLMVGADAVALERCRPILDALAEHVVVLGPTGAGMAAKLINNVLGISAYAALLEAMQLAAAYGMDEDTVTEFVSKGWGDSRHVHAWGRQDRRRRERLDADAGAYSRMSRDLEFAAEAARSRGVEMPLTESAARLLPALLLARDTEPQRWLPGLPAPRCAVCTIELSAPFRAAGVHPECVAEQGSVAK